MLRFKIFHDFLPDVDLSNARAGTGHRLGKHNGGAIRVAVFYIVICAARDQTDDAVHRYAMDGKTGVSRVRQYTAFNGVERQNRKHALF